MKTGGTVKGFLCYILAHKSLLPDFVSTGNFFLACSGVGLIALCRSGSVCCICLCELCADLRRIDENEGVTFMNHITFSGIKRLYTARNLSGNTVFGSLSLTLNYSLFRP